MSISDMYSSAMSTISGDDHDTLFLNELKYHDMDRMSSSSSMSPDRGSVSSSSSSAASNAVQYPSVPALAMHTSYVNECGFVQRVPLLYPTPSPSPPNSSSLALALSNTPFSINSSVFSSMSTSALNESSLISMSTSLNDSVLLNSSTMSSVSSKGRRGRKRKSLITNEDDKSNVTKFDENEVTGLPVHCALCKKTVEWKNRSRHSLFHGTIFRFYCNKCDYCAHMRCNVKTHVTLKHSDDPEAAVMERKSAELAIEVARLFEECFPGNTKPKNTIKCYSGRPAAEDVSYLQDSIVSRSNETTLSANTSSLDESVEGSIRNIIAGQTYSSRLVNTIEKKATECCQRCKRIVTRAKTINHAITHATRHRYRCSHCGVGYHCRFNLAAHIKTQHDEQAEVLDEVDEELQEEYDQLVKECFPDYEAGKRKRTKQVAAQEEPVPEKRRESGRPKKRRTIA